jgi:hypothetical protein
MLRLSRQPRRGVAGGSAPGNDAPHTRGPSPCSPCGPEPHMRPETSQQASGWRADGERRRAESGIRGFPSVGFTQSYSLGSPPKNKERSNPFESGRWNQRFNLTTVVGFAATFGILLILAALQPIYLRGAPTGISNLSPAPGQQACSEISEQSPDTLARALATALSQGQDKKAREILRKILKRPQLDPDFLLAVGGQFAQHDQYAEAALAFSRCVRDHPAVFEAHYNLALAEFAEGKLAEALAAFGSCSA